ncbi:MAG: P1 family peptidase [Deinococcales bacterium]
MSLTSVEGIKVGHWQDTKAHTGCTVILCPPEGCIASGSIRGSAPGSRETALLAPEKSVERIHALCLSGGSAFGLATAEGVMRYLSERDIGFPTPFLKVPIVSAAVIYDFWLAEPMLRDVTVKPNAEQGYLAAQHASAEEVKPGRYGAATGARCGKYLGLANSSEWGGLGSSALLVQGVTIAALSIANPFGDITQEGQVIAGAHLADGARPKNRLESMKQFFPAGNTTLVAVATDAAISKTEASILADQAHIGIAQVMRPSHTPFDGDSTFVLSTGQGRRLPLAALAIAVQQVVAEALIKGALAANGVER